eukprot:403339266
MGPTGAGKSSLLNDLSNTNFFKVCHGLQSGTQKEETLQAQWPGTNLTANFIDTIGSDGNQKDAYMKEVSALKDGLNLILFLIPVTSSRLSLSVINSMKATISMIGQQYKDHILVVLTQSGLVVQHERDPRVKSYKDQILPIFASHEVSLNKEQLIVYVRGHKDDFRKKILQYALKKETFLPESSKEFKNAKRLYPELSTQQISENLLQCKPLIQQLENIRQNQVVEQQRLRQIVEERRRIEEEKKRVELYHQQEKDRLQRIIQRKREQAQLIQRRNTYSPNIFENAIQHVVDDCSGKSYLLNKLSGQKKLFKIGNDLQSYTDMPQKERIVIKADGQEHDVILLDTVGFEDNRVGFELKNFATMVEMINPGINLALYLIPVTGTRLSMSDIKSLKVTLNILGKQSSKHIFIIFTQIERVNQQDQKSKLKLYMNQTCEILAEHSVKLPKEQILVFRTEELEEFRDTLIDYSINLGLYQPAFSEEIKRIQQENPELPIEQVVQLAAFDKASPMGQLMEMRMKELEKTKKLLVDQSEYLEEAKEELKVLKENFKNEKDSLQELIKHMEKKNHSQRRGVFGWLGEQIDEFLST